ncbi:MAG: YaiI/YqxD family protein [Rhodospirillaceae bacterium]|nr:YaiI/YqxD family protein [Rhodospirillaceae bacterium]
MAERGVEIFVDADACPVKDEVARVAARHKLVTHLVSNQWMRGPDDPLIRRVVVGTHKLDAADDWIAENVLAHDIVITADIPLAARVVAKGATVLRPNGEPLDQSSIGMAAAMRDLNTHLRDSGMITGGPAPFNKNDRSRFLDRLETAVRAALKAKPAA